MLKLGGIFIVNHLRDGELLDKYKFHNGVTGVGLNAILNIMFHGSTQASPWYIGLVDNSGYTSFSFNDTMSSHGGWSEFTDYAEAARETWDEAAASGQVIGTTTAAEFNINATGDVKGIFITSSSTKSGTAGTLWATGGFTSVVSVVSGDILEVEYELSAAVS